MSKISRKFERIFKGAANHRRIDILLLLKRHPDQTLFAISQKLDCNLKTIAEHTRRLFIAGLIDKSRFNNMVLHNLSPYGEKVCEFINDL